VPVCSSCGQDGAASYCPTCGQEQVSQTPTVAEWLGETIDELFLVERKVPKTLIQLARPGNLTAAWLSGQRTRYMRPFRLFLLSAAVAFLSMSVEASVLDYGSSGQSILRWYLILLAVPIFALATRVGFAYDRPVESMMPFVIHSLHFHSFVLLLVAIASMVRLAVQLAVGPVPDTVFLPVAMILLVYLAASGRRSFQVTLGRAVLGAGISVLTYLAITFPILWLIVYLVLRNRG
jgi:hypothetical protein